MVLMNDCRKIRSEYDRWVSNKSISEQLRDELLSVAKDSSAIQDRFWQHLSFGTGGLRGLIGAGTNRMNEFVVRRATQGLADYLVKNDGTSVCIGWDTRIMSREFAQIAAETLCANGIIVYMFTNARPTPMLSFAVRQKLAFAGIVITASHNPYEYNGYKVYGPDGGQITDEAAESISANINIYDILSDIPRLSVTSARMKGLYFDLDDIDDLYYYKVKMLVSRSTMVAQHATKLSVLYTPLHGTGNTPIRRILSDLGFTNLSVVTAQESPDGNFPTVISPNPEEALAFAIALEQANGHDIILATDPDCDRVGVYAKNKYNKYSALTGNQIGVLLCDYLIEARREKGTLDGNAAIIKTIVTTDLVRRICENSGVATIDTLTGFKYIGEKIGEWERSFEHTFIFGFEESYGYLAGDFVRDKDAVIATVLICEMALFYKLKKMSLHDALENLFAKFGYADECLVSITLKGIGGVNQIKKIMDIFRYDAIKLLGNENITSIEDYLNGFRDLPKSDVLKFIFDDNSWLAVRPSGTEPKIKFYFGAIGNTKDIVNTRLQHIEKIVRQAVDNTT